MHKERKRRRRRLPKIEVPALRGTSLGARGIRQKVGFPTNERSAQSQPRARTLAHAAHCWARFNGPARESSRRLPHQGQKVHSKSLFCCTKTRGAHDPTTCGRSRTPRTAGRASTTVCGAKPAVYRFIGVCGLDRVGSTQKGARRARTDHAAVIAWCDAGFLTAVVVLSLWFAIYATHLGFLGDACSHRRLRPSVKKQPACA